MLNNVTLIGNISTEIDMRFTPNGNGVCKFNLAVSDPFNKEHTDFIPVEVWKKQAENTANYCGKGSKIAVVGRIRIEQYEKDGQKRTFTKVVASQVVFLDSKKDKQQNNDPFKNESTPADIDPNDLPFR